MSACLTKKLRICETHCKTFPLFLFFKFSSPNEILPRFSVANLPNLIESAKRWRLPTAMSSPTSSGVWRVGAKSSSWLTRCSAGNGTGTPESLPGNYTKFQFLLICIVVGYMWDVRLEFVRQFKSKKFVRPPSKVGMFDSHLVQLIRPTN